MKFVTSNCSGCETEPKFGRFDRERHYFEGSKWPNSSKIIFDWKKKTFILNFFFGLLKTEMAALFLRFLAEDITVHNEDLRGI